MEWDAIVNAIFSFIVPGVGQAIDGYKQRGIILFVIFLILLLVYLLVTKENPIMRIVLFIYSLFAAYDAYRLY